MGWLCHLSRHSVGTFLKTSSHTTCQGTFRQSSQLAEPLWTDPGIKSGNSVCELISTSKKKKKAHAANQWLNILQKFCKRGKCHHHHQCKCRRRFHVFFIFQHTPMVIKYCWKQIQTFEDKQAILNDVHIIHLIYLHPFIRHHVIGIFIRFLIYSFYYLLAQFMHILATLSQTFVNTVRRFTVSAINIHCREFWNPVNSSTVKFCPKSKVLKYLYCTLFL